MKSKVKFQLNTDSITFLEAEDCFYMQVRMPKSYRWLVERIKAVLEKGKEYTIRITNLRKKRSERQNALLWGLIDEVVMHQIGRNDEEAKAEYYCDILQRYGCEHTEAMYLPEAVREIRRSGLDLSNNVLYRAVRVLNETIDKKGRKWQHVRLYYGTSSEYDTVGFNQLIEGILDDMATLGLDTQIYYPEYEQLKEKDYGAKTNDRPKHMDK